MANNDLFKIMIRDVQHFTKAVNGKTKRYVKGIASGTNLDRDTERMAQSTIYAMRKAILEGIFLDDGQWSYVPLRAGHREDWEGDILGWIMDAEIDEHFNLIITAELDDEEVNAGAALLWSRLTRSPEKGKPVQLGLSIGGRIISAGEEWDDILLRFVRVFYEIALTEVSVVSRPANPITYLVALSKSVDWNNMRNHKVDDMKENDMKPSLPNEAEVAAKAATELEIVASEANVEEVAVAKTEDAVAETEVVKTETVEDAPAEEVAKAAEASENVDEVALVEEVAKATDPTLELSTQLASVMQQIADLTKAVSAMTTKSIATQESEPVVEAVLDNVEKTVAETHPSDEVVVKAVEAVVETPVVEVISKALTVDDIASVIKSAIGDALVELTARITQIENEPIDKSFAVAAAKTGGDIGSIVDLYEKDAMELHDGRDALRMALERAYG